MTTSTTPQTNESDPDAQIAAQGTDVEILPDVNIDARWWGYTIVMNQPAALCMDTVLDEMEKKLLKHFHGETAAAIKALVFLKKTRIEGVANRTKDGCQLVSPWILPFALAVVRNNSGGDQNLWCTVWDPDQGKWGEQAEFNDGVSYSGPALAQHGDLLYCVHRGSSDDESMFWNVYSTNDGWSDDQKFTNQNCKTATTPSLVEFNNKLYCFYRGSGDNKKLYSSSFDTATKTWSPGHEIMVGSLVQSSDTGCAATVFNGNNGKLYLAYAACLTQSIRIITSDDGITWGGLIDTTYETADTPAIVAYKQKLLIVHRGGHNNTRMYSTTSDDGVSWSKDLSMGEYWSDQGPALAVFEDEKVYMVHRWDRANGELMYAIYDGNSWSPDTHIEGQSTGETPALAVYKDPQCTPENYVDPKTAVPRLICVHRGWGKNI